MTEPKINYFTPPYPMLVEQMEAERAKAAKREAYWATKGQRKPRGRRILSFQRCAACRSTQGPFMHGQHVGCPGHPPEPTRPDGTPLFTAPHAAAKATLFERLVSAVGLKVNP